MSEYKKKGGGVEAQYRFCRQVHAKRKVKYRHGKCKQKKNKKERRRKESVKDAIIKQSR
jgi:hypothetical protein